MREYVPAFVNAFADHAVSFYSIYAFAHAIQSWNQDSSQ